MNDKEIDIAAVESIIGYNFKDKKLLKTALTHSSYANERMLENYERLEYLGDSVLGFFAAEFLYRKTNGAEGNLTEERKGIVSEKALVKISESLGFPAIMLNRLQDEPSAKVKSDLVESMIAAVYLDGGIEAARKFFDNKLIVSLN